VTVRVEYAGSEMGRNQPLWPVRALVFVAADDATKSFAGDLDGTLNWRTGRMQLSGTVTNGWRRNARIEETLSLDRERLDGTSTTRVAQLTAER
jgi:hypothetical protein